MSSASKPVVTRFAPSPTGFLHIGSARTALFCWLFAKHHGGKNLLRIEDTDRARSTPESIDTILDGLTWLGLDWDNKDYNGRSYYSQYEQRDRHADVARQMVANGKAYYCYATPEELDAMRAEQKEKGLPQRYDGRWRARPASDAPAGIKPVIRLKAPQDGETTVHDAVMGRVTVQNSQLDDMILLRSDGTPTYMHAVVVDDHDMEVTHVIRGDDHLTNTFRQVQIYKAMGWDVPTFAHLPMILGPDGAKLSKRHGAPAVGDYRDRGYLPEAICNYLLRLCWSHGDDEIISREQAVEWFDLDGIGKSPARFDFAKLGSVNAHYIKQADDARLAKLAEPFIARALGRPLTMAQMDLLARAMTDLKPRAQTIADIADMAVFYFHDGALPMDDKAQKLLTPDAKAILADMAARMEKLDDFTAHAVEEACRAYAEEKGIKLGAVAQPLRAALSGSTVSPPIFGVAAILGRDETLRRVKSA
ncbi:MAG: glutamate--tRNA ligase [Alphaproteobacteria bacterium]|nr:glutamate--tRNA ligase [Alphaproteobacteria bacterium]